MLSIPQSTAHRVMFMAFLASDHLTPATGKTIAITISKNGAAFANPSAGATNATAVSNGWYYVDLSTTDTATAGPLAIRGAEGTIDDIGILRQVMAATSGLINVNAQLAGGSAVDSAATVAAAVVTAMDSTSADLNTLITGQATIAGYLDTEITAIKTKTDFLPSATAGAAGGVAIVGSAMSLSVSERNSIADAHLDRADGIETNVTPRQATRWIGAAAAGVVAGAGTSVITIAALRNPATNRITTASSDASGNRPTVTLNP